MTRLASGIRLAGISIVLATGGTAMAAEGGWTTLFDGKSTQGWRCYNRTDVPASAWTIDNGTLHAVPGAKERCDLITRDKYRDFELELEWKVAPGGNSGIFYHVVELPAPSEAYHSGPEMQVLDDARHADGKNPLTSAGALYALIAPERKTLHPAGQWNKAGLIVRGNHVEHWLNGAKIVEYELGSPQLQTLIAQSRFKDMPRFAKAPDGYIALQHHGQEVWFRNVRVRRLGGP
jgi:hypothetical protein